MEMQVTAEASCALLERAAGVASTVAKTPFFTFCLTIPYYHYTEHFTGGAPHRSLAGQHLPCIILSPWCSSGLLYSEMRILPKATGLEKMAPKWEQRALILPRICGIYT